MSMCKAPTADDAALLFLLPLSLSIYTITAYLEAV